MNHNIYQILYGFCSKLEKTNTTVEHVTSTIKTKENDKNTKERADGFAGLNTSVSMSLPEASGKISMSSTEYQNIEIGPKLEGKESVKQFLDAILEQIYWLSL
ncbi:uncharacterized protein LOC127855219 [Dreissena polymorpha]|uniref:uncharacterized protein LOC127855219 n=1 Tax=Dreissena polymorpha TaxID=45954 RepID=UPI002264655B|nr:uncharacterized protein LOC127855219 [Dreissena polymorpha]